MAGVEPESVLTDVMRVMRDLSEEWDYSGPITPDTRFFADMEVRSLDFVILSTALARLYGRLPFDEFYTQLSERPPEDREVTVREYADFVTNKIAAT